MSAGADREQARRLGKGAVKIDDVHLRLFNKLKGAVTRSSRQHELGDGLSKIYCGYNGFPENLSYSFRSRLAVDVCK